MFELGLVSGFSIGLALGTIIAGVVGYFKVKKKLLNLTSTAQEMIVDQVKTRGPTVIRSVTKRFAK